MTQLANVFIVLILLMMSVASLMLFYLLIRMMFDDIVDDIRSLRIKSARKRAYAQHRGMESIDKDEVLKYFERARYKAKNLERAQEEGYRPVTKLNTNKPPESGSAVK